MYLVRIRLLLFSTQERSGTFVGYQLSVFKRFYYIHMINRSSNQRLVPANRFTRPDQKTHPLCIAYAYLAVQSIKKMKKQHLPKNAID